MYLSIKHSKKYNVSVQMINIRDHFELHNMGDMTLVRSSGSHVRVAGVTLISML